MPKNATVERALAAIATDDSKKLGVVINGETITTAQFFGRAAAQKAPDISYDASKPSTKYIVVALDLDAPFPSFGALGPILHWIQPGLTIDTAGKLSTTEPFGANYIGPAPPSSSAPHRYSFFLFTQPELFDGAKYAPANGKPLGLWPRVRFDLDKWMKKTGVGEPPAANYFLSN